MRILITGVQGSGKSTHSKKLAEKYGFVHISTGDLLRKHIEEETEIGKSYKSDYEKGIFASDAILFQMIEEELSKSEVKEKGWILDGFPRNKKQLEWFTERCGIDKCIELIVPEKEAIERLLKRNRNDDTEKSIKKRISDYQEKTQCIADYYRTIDKTHPLSTDLPEEVTFKYLEGILKLDSKLYSRIRSLEKELRDINETKIKKLSITSNDILVIKYPDYRMPKAKMEEHMRKCSGMVKETLKDKIGIDIPILSMTHGIEFEAISFEDWEKKPQ